MLAQGANFLLRLVTVMILARLLEPTDFGLVGMVTAFTGALGLFRDFGLSAATIQRATITEEQVSTLFWISLLIGVALGLVALAIAPAIVALYHEPRLLEVTAALALGFVCNSAGLQHSALLQRQMRFTSLAIINTVSLVAGGAVAIFAASIGLGYWALVIMAVAIPLTTSIGSWIVLGWIPGRPQRRIGMRSMMRFGGILTMNTLVVYGANNLDKILVGRYFGVDALGIYGRASQLVSIPIDNLNSAGGEVAFSALSRIQHDAARLKSYFLKGYSLILTITLPVAIACTLFAQDLIAVLLGPKWSAAGPLFRLMAPTIFGFAVVNPLGWLIYSLGMAGRGLKMALVIAPFMILGYIVGLPFGLRGVACAYSAVVLLWIVPAIAWAVHGTTVSVRDVTLTMSRPLAAGFVSGALAFGVGRACGHLLPIARLGIETMILLLTYVALLFFFGGQKSLYLAILRSLRHRGIE